jgi:hypothetical protein
MDTEKINCPFCITSWICDGPHIESIKDQTNLFKYMNYSKQDYIFNMTDEIRKYSMETGLDLKELSDRIKERVEKRDR